MTFRTRTNSPGSIGIGIEPTQRDLDFVLQEELQ
jgi:hypothetical protein